MKNLLAPPTRPSTARLPDFGGRPRRMNLEQLTAVKGCGKVNLRPIRIEDEQAMIRFHQKLSEESIYLRYFEYLGLDRRTAHERLMRICRNTPESYAVVVEKTATPHRPAEILAVGRLTQMIEPFQVTFDILMNDDASARALGKVLMHRLVKLARAFGYRVLTGELLVADHDTLNLCRSLGFTLQTRPQDGLVQVILDL